MGTLFHHLWFSPKYIPTFSFPIVHSIPYLSSCSRDILALPSPSHLSNSSFELLNKSSVSCWDRQHFSTPPICFSYVSHLWAFTSNFCWILYLMCLLLLLTVSFQLSSSSSIESNGASSRRRNMPMMYQMYESQVSFSFYLMLRTFSNTMLFEFSEIFP